MNKLNIGLIGYGTVGQGVARWLIQEKQYFRNKIETDCVLKTVCDRSIEDKNTAFLKGVLTTKDIDDVLKDSSLDIIIELIGGTFPAKRIVSQALKRGKHVITANKALIARYGEELFALAERNNCGLLYESAVGAGIPIIKTITEGIAGNTVSGVYGIINGTCNFILDAMTQHNINFDESLRMAQQKGYAESDPTLDINGQDAAHKLAILVYLAFGKKIEMHELTCEGITHISYEDISFAKEMGLCIKLLAIAKSRGETIEARVHPTLIQRDHPLASINGVLNAVYLETKPLGDILLSGEGAGQMAAASGVICDLVNIASHRENHLFLCNRRPKRSLMELADFDDIRSRFYLRLLALDKPGVLGKITGILGKHHIGINSVSQQAHYKASNVPVILLTDMTTQRQLGKALTEIRRLSSIKGKPVTIRMEDL